MVDGSEVVGQIGRRWRRVVPMDREMVKRDEIGTADACKDSRMTNDRRAARQIKMERQGMDNDDG